jgi:hypothetical protein
LEQNYSKLAADQGGLEEMTEWYRRHRQGIEGGPWPERIRQSGITAVSRHLRADAREHRGAGRAQSLAKAFSCPAPRISEAMEWELRGARRFYEPGWACPQEAWGQLIPQGAISRSGSTSKAGVPQLGTPACYSNAPPAFTRDQVPDPLCPGPNP